MPKLDNTSLPPPQLSPPHAPPPCPSLPSPPPRSALQPTNPHTTHSSHARILWSPVLIWVETFWALAWGGGEGGRWVDTREAGGEAASTRSSFLIRTCLEFRPLSHWRACLFTVLLLSTLSWALVAPSRSSDQSAAPIDTPCSWKWRRASVFLAMIAHKQNSLFSCLQNLDISDIYHDIL